MEQKEIDRRFNYSPGDTDQQTICANLRWKFKELATFVNIHNGTPREQALAITKMEEALYWAIASIVRPHPSED